MRVDERLNVLLELHDVISNESGDFPQVIERAYQQNKWFTGENIRLALKNINEKFLNESKLMQWISAYPLKYANPKTIGIVMAGNIPLVGFHDFICTFMSGNRVMVKLSSKDEKLFMFLLQQMMQKNTGLKDWVTITQVLKGMDAIIATGSNNSSRYFEYYFSKYPHIIRKNRNAVAVLNGYESRDEIEQLGFDIFSYFGLGCRNVSKLMVPEGYQFDFFFDAIDVYSKLNEHNKYKNNYDYNRAVLLLNKTPHLANDFIILKEDLQVASPVALVHYEYYKNEGDLKQKLERDASAIQCVIGKGFIPFGESQSPELWDYADRVDTLQFLTTLQ
jgi:hypothetical protein